METSKPARRDPLGGLANATIKHGLLSERSVLERFSLGWGTVGSQGLRFNADPGWGHRRILGTRVHSRPIMNDERSSRAHRSLTTRNLNHEPNRSASGSPEQSQPRFPRTKPMSSWAIPRTKPMPVSPNEANVNLGNPRNKANPCSPNEANVNLGNPRTKPTPVSPIEANDRMRNGGMIVFHVLENRSRRQHSSLRATIESRWRRHR